MKDVRIAREKTRKDWKIRKGELKTDSLLWSETFEDFFKGRIESRYFGPIDRINICHSDSSDSPLEGEGFAIVAILCSLIEFLETCRTGSIFKVDFKTPKGGSVNYPAVKPPHSYGRGASEAIFTKFLKDHLYFSEDVAKSFYKNVRCAILHNAMTEDPWVIKVSPSGVEANFQIVGDTKVLYRDNLLSGLKKYVSDYKQELLSSDDLQNAFIRKFDTL